MTTDRPTFLLVTGNGLEERPAAELELSSTAAQWQAIKGMLAEGDETPEHVYLEPLSQWLDDPHILIFGDEEARLKKKPIRAFALCQGNEPLVGRLIFVHQGVLRDEDPLYQPLTAEQIGEIKRSFMFLLPAEQEPLSTWYYAHVDPASWTIFQTFTTLEEMPQALHPDA